MDFSELTRLAGGYAEARAVQAAVELGVFDALKESGDPAHVAQATRGDARATELLLNALAAIGLLDKKGARYSLNETSACYLVRGSPQFLGGMIAFDSSLWRTWGDLEQAVRSGKPARAPDMYQNEPAETERFINAMDSLVRARGDAEIVAETLDLGNVGEMIDVGAGPATYPIALCRKFPALRATIFDLPATLKVTEKFVRASDVGERIKLIPGDYRRDNIPGRYQLAFLSNIIHGEGSEENERLITKIYGSLDDGGRIVIKDHILDDSRTRPSAGAIFSLLMLLTTESGKCYSLNEVKSWLEKTGFERVHEVTLPSPLTSSLVVGIKREP